MKSNYRSKFVLFSAALFTAAVTFAIFPRAALALHIDEFSGVQSLAVDASTTESASTIPDASAIGGSRTVAITFSSGLGGVSARVNGGSSAGVFIYSEDASTSGHGDIVWDGDLSSINFSPAGLGGIDLTQDAGTAIRLSNVSFDLPFGRSIALTFTLYDASDAAGNTWSSATTVLTQAYSAATIDVPFSSFTMSGPGGAASTKNVGAITLHIDGTNPDVDMLIDTIGTNGTCDLIPVNKKVIDVCGVCGGDGLSCLDCAGVPFGGSTIDRCGVCGGNGSSCSCKTSPLTLQRKNIKAAASILVKRVVHFTTDSKLCDHKSRAAEVKTAHLLFNELMNGVAQTYGQGILSCTASVCATSTLKDKLAVLRRLGNQLGKLGAAVKIEAIKTCHTVSGGGGSGSSHGSVSDAYRLALLKQISTLPKFKTVCSR